MPACSARPSHGIPPLSSGGPSPSYMFNIMAAELIKTLFLAFDLIFRPPEETERGA